MARPPVLLHPDAIALAVDYLVRAQGRSDYVLTGGPGEQAEQLKRLHRLVQKVPEAELPEAFNAWLEVNVHAEVRAKMLGALRQRKAYRGGGKNRRASLALPRGVLFAVEELANELGDDVTPAALIDALAYVAKTNLKVKALVAAAIRDSSGRLV